MRTIFPRISVLPILGILTVLAFPAFVSAQEEGWSRFETAVYAGVFDVANSSPPFEAGLELRRSTSIAGMAIMGGVTATQDSSAWIYAGARYEVPTRGDWIVAPGFAAALYEQGDGKDLGQTLEFRSSIEMGRRVSEQLAVGLVFYHLSNASMSDHNPGSNSLVLNFSFRRPRSRG